MSSTLCFRKTPKKVDREDLHCKQPLKGIFAERYYDHDGSLGGDIQTLTVSDLPWIQGVRAAFRGDERDRKLLDRIVELLESDETVDMWFEI